MFCLTLCVSKDTNKFLFLSELTAMFAWKYLEGLILLFRKQPNTRIFKTEVFCYVKLSRMEVHMFVVNRRGITLQKT
jgi:hypothetical protein